MQRLKPSLSYGSRLQALETDLMWVSPTYFLLLHPHTAPLRPGIKALLSTEQHICPKSAITEAR